MYHAPEPAGQAHSARTRCTIVYYVVYLLVLLVAHAVSW